MKTIFTYLDYRTYLRDWYEEAKKKNSFVSYRYIGGRTGMDASFLVKVFQKQAHIADKSIERVAAFLKLPAAEGEYFDALVSFNKAKRPADIQLHYQRLVSQRTPYVKVLEADQHEFFSQWYYVAVYELLRCVPFDGADFRGLARKLRPPISTDEAKQGIALLLRLGLIEATGAGSFVVKDASLSTGDAWLSIAISDFQKRMIGMGIDAMDTIPAAERDISTVTISLSHATFESVRGRMQNFRRELLEIARDEAGPEDVYQVSFQVFPLSKTDSRAVKS